MYHGVFVSKLWMHKAMREDAESAPPSDPVEISECEAFLGVCMVVLVYTLMLGFLSIYRFI